MITNKFHYIPDMEFSGLFDITHGRIIFLKYFLFIKFNDYIYIDIKSIGDVIMPFEEFRKNKLLKMYYELSLLLIENKNIIIENDLNKFATLANKIINSKKSREFNKKKFYKKKYSMNLITENFYNENIIN